MEHYCHPVPQNQLIPLWGMGKGPSLSPPNILALNHDPSLLKGNTGSKEVRAGRGREPRLGGTESGEPPELEDRPESPSC